MLQRLTLGVIAAALWLRPALGEDRAQTIRVAIERGVQVLERGATNYPKNRECFSCHHQTLPLLGWTESRKAGCQVTEAVLPVQLAFSQKTFTERRERLSTGKSIGGRAATASYGLWTWAIADAPADETSDAIVDYLLAVQNSDGSWQPQSQRPPLEESTLSCTVLSAVGLKRYARGARQETSPAAIERASHWVATAPRRTHEDLNFALWATTLLGTRQPSRPELLDELQQSQRDDGGWGAMSSLDSDAYATGQTLYVLLETPWPLSADMRDRAVEWLLRSQEPDGSWHVVTRSKPIQEWFDNGDPHGPDQFISIAATGWAVAGLARHLQELTD